MDGKKESETASPAGRKFTSVQAVARRWNVSESTVRRLIDEGELSGVRIRKSYKIKLDSVLDYESRSTF